MKRLFVIILLGFLMAIPTFAQNISDKLDDIGMACAEANLISVGDSTYDLWMTVDEGNCVDTVYLFSIPIPILNMYDDGAQCMVYGRELMDMPDNYLKRVGDNLISYGGRVCYQANILFYRWLQTADFENLEKIAQKPTKFRTIDE